MTYVERTYQKSVREAAPGYFIKTSQGTAVVVAGLKTRHSLMALRESWKQPVRVHCEHHDTQIPIPPSFIDVHVYTRLSPQNAPARALSRDHERCSPC